MSNYPPPPPPPPPSPPPGEPGWGGPAQQWTPPGQPQYPTQPPYGAASRFAGFWARVGAAVIDGIILSPFGIIGRLVLENGAQEERACGFNSQLVCEGPAGSTWALWGLITIAGVVAAVLYYGLLEGRSGQTVGKRALGIRVLDARSGAPIGVGRAIGRYFAKYLSAVACGLGFLWMLWDPNKQTWHDKIVGSYVVTT